MPKLLEFTENYRGVFINVNQFRGSPIETRIWCRNCQKAVNAYHAKLIKQLALLPPQNLTIRSFCATCGWVYQKRPIPLGIRIQVEKLDNRECVYCGLKKAKRFSFGLDHLTPEIEGGQATIQNLVLVCRECNSTKGRRKTYYKPRFGRFKKMLLKYLITTRLSPDEVVNKYAVYEGSNRLRAPAGHSDKWQYHESKAEKETKVKLANSIKGVVIQSMPDPADHNYVLFEALRPVKLEIEIPS